MADLKPLYIPPGTSDDVPITLYSNAVLNPSGYQWIIYLEAATDQDPMGWAVMCDVDNSIATVTAADPNMGGTLLGDCHGVACLVQNDGDQYWSLYYGVFETQDGACDNPLQDKIMDEIKKMFSL